jgi:hypothetical protein
MCRPGLFPAFLLCVAKIADRTSHGKVCADRSQGPREKSAGEGLDIHDGLVGLHDGQGLSLADMIAGLLVPGRKTTRLHCIGENGQWDGGLHRKLLFLD